MTAAAHRDGRLRAVTAGRGVAALAKPNLAQPNLPEANLGQSALLGAGPLPRPRQCDSERELRRFTIAPVTEWSRVLAATFLGVRASGLSVRLPAPRSMRMVAWSPMALYNTSSQGGDVYSVIVRRWWSGVVRSWPPTAAGLFRLRSGVWENPLRMGIDSAATGKLRSGS